MKSPSRVSRASLLTVAGLLVIGIAALTSVSIPGQSLFREVTLLDLLMGVSPIDLPSLAYTGGLFFIGFAATVIGLVLLVARVY
ncbi:hypothetical protein [Haloplanus aerogenes]|uniref:Uncharacterized protein n=1 Tax=Haloplanus aerogenes TaxID=660522 RepID=A0A3M0D1N4_9EURY|nr:hypothetical protein [Haloplanus aerogenes]AZH23885.1 hypothetical protein DU502_00185 [Haloplanus aerogenes]RMB13356.1 hypothetical protein ATH50_2689 [Haloplanus aerogenes]